MGRVPDRGVWRALLVGACLALVLGWLGYPRIAFVSLTQPIRFSHSAHLKQDMACAVCHFTAPAGTFAGLPDLAVCAACHPAPTGGASDDEKEIDKLVWDYVKKGKAVPWLAYQRQPGHVRFTHQPHLTLGCPACHPDMSREDYPSLRKNRLSGAVAGWTTPMAKCRACHEQRDAANDCLVCHR
jgi:menaquinone reductase, multiheme cytochrome c subunit